MADWRPLTARDDQRTDVLFDASGQVVFRTEQEVQPVLDLAKAMRDCGDGGWVMGKDYRRVATIPNVLIAKWREEGIDVWSGEHQDAVARKLNDPDYFYLRTAPGRLGPAGDGTYH